MTSYLTTATKDWLEKIEKDKFYKILIIEGEDLKNRLIEFPDLIERFFSIGRYEQLFSDVKNHWFGYSVEPSYEILKELATHMHPQSLTINELGFLFISLYKHYQFFQIRNDYYGDFDTRVFSPYYERLKELAGLEKMSLFAEFKDDFSHIGGNGVIEEIDNVYEGEEPRVEEIYQYYTLHLNPGAPREYWSIGHYLLFKLEDAEAFEIFSLENSDYTTAIQYHPNFEMHQLEKLTLEMPQSTEDAVRKYFLEK